MSEYICVPHGESACPECHKYIIGVESELSLLRSKVERLERLLRRNLECMKFINGPDNKCLLKNVDKCPNHRLIHETEAALSDVGIISSFDGREWKRSPTPEDRLHGIGCGCCPCHHDTTCKWYKKGSEGEKA